MKLHRAEKARILVAAAPPSSPAMSPCAGQHWHPHCRDQGHFTDQCRQLQDAWRSQRLQVSGPLGWQLWAAGGVGAPCLLLSYRSPGLTSLLGSLFTPCDQDQSPFPDSVSPFFKRGSPMCYLGTTSSLGERQLVVG